MGSHFNQECKIDSIAQSWSILSGEGNRERSKIALESVNKYLINREDKIIKLFTPPFDTSPVDPGYIKGYVPATTPWASCIWNCIKAYIKAEAC